MNRAVRRRLVTLVGMLLLVLVLMHEASQPGNWTWLWQASPPANRGASSSDTPPVHLTQTDQSDTLEDSDWPASAAPATRPQARDLRSFAAVSFHQVEDDTVFLPSEQEAWFNLWSLLAQTSPQELAEQARQPVEYLQLYRQMNAYRGKVVQLAGTLRRAHRVAAPENTLGLEHYWICWLFGERRDEGPIVVYVLEMPAAFPTGMELHESVQLCAVPFKRWAYQTPEGSRVAPVVLAKTLTWNRSAIPPAVRRFSPRDFTLAVAAILLFAIIAVKYLDSATRKPRVSRREARDRNSSDVRIEIPPEMVQNTPAEHDS